MNLFGHLVGLLGRGIGSMQASTYTGEHNTEKRGYTSMLRTGSNHDVCIPAIQNQNRPHTSRPLGPDTVVT